MADRQQTRDRHVCVSSRAPGMQRETCVHNGNPPAIVVD